MEAIHKLKIDCPYEMLKIEDIKISCKPNSHGYLYLKCLIDDSINFKYSIEASTEDKITLYEELKDEEKSIIFTGIIESARTTNENGIYYLELEGASSSSLLDMKQKTRSFQDAQMSYDDLINEILKDYKELGFTQRMSRPMSISKPLFQFKETDYEFLKRVASLLGLELICDIINYGNAFHFGRPDGKSYELEDGINYRVCKDLERYYKAKTGGFGVDFDHTDFFYYEIESPQNMDLGDKIYFKQKDLYVNQYEAELNKGELIYKYRFCREEGIWQEKIYNHKIKGISLEGKVLETAGEKVKLHLNIDESQDPSKAAWFYYAPPTGNILYSMPIVGEGARLYFQDEIDSDPIVTGCIRKNGSTCEAMSDTANRYFATESGNYLDMLPGAISFHRSGLNVNLNDENGITFSSPGNISISGGSVNLSAGSVSINATSQIKVQKSAGSYISLENEFYAQASVVYESGSDRESYSAFTDDEPTAGVKEALAKLEAEFKEKQLMEAMSGSEAKAKECIVPASKDSVPLEGEDLKNRDDIPEFDVNKEYEEGTVVKQKSLDGEYVLGKTSRVLNDRGGVSEFTPYDSNSYSEHNSYLNSFKSMGLAGVDFAQKTFWEGAKVFSYAGEFFEFAESKIGLITYSEDSWDLGRQKCDEISSSWHNSLYNAAPHKVVFNSSELVFNIYGSITGGVGIASAVKNIPKLINEGLKVAGVSKTASKLEDMSGIFRSGESEMAFGSNISNSIGKTGREVDNILDTSKVGEDIANTEKSNGIGKAIENDANAMKNNNLEEDISKTTQANKVSKSEETDLDVPENVDKVEKVNQTNEGGSEAVVKKKSIPDFVKKQWEAGNNFNKENRPRYPYNEVELKAKDIDGKKYVVDSYIPGKEIISRKFTQLAEVQEKTALSYLSEFTKKYSSGSEVSAGKFDPNALKGSRLEGELILEVPVQIKPIPKTILDEATKRNIIIRDITGKVYN